MVFSRLWSPLLRAGAFGTLHGGHPGEAGVGLTVPVPSCEALSVALNTLEQQKVQATLLLESQVATECEEQVVQAVECGHEVAGMNLPLDFTRLEALTGQQARFWWLDQDIQHRENFQRLQQAGLAPLPALTQTPQPGAILHVSVKQLPEVLSHLKSLGYRPQPVREMKELRAARPRDLFEFLYQQLVEERYSQREGLLDLSQRFDAVMKVAALDHAPDPLPLPRQTPTAELHLNSQRVVGLASKNLMATYKAYQRSLRDVARALQTRPELQDAQAVFAVTLFHSPLEKSGFTLLDLPPLRARWYGLGFRLLRAAYGTTRTPSEGTPKMAWMTREAFLSKYGE